VSDIDRVIALLKDPSIEKQIAAAVVLGELRVRSPKCVEELTRLVESEVPLMQRHALDALTRVGAKRAVPKIFPLLVAHDAELRRSAAAAIASVGDEVVPTIRARMGEAGPEERRALDAILAELGGKEAFHTLITGLASSDGEAAKAAALAVRQQVKSADARQRKSYFAETERFLKQQTKVSGAPGAVAAAIKILGYLEDEKAIPTLLAYATSKSEPPLIKQEAFIALRFALGARKTPPKVILALIDAAESTDRTLAQTALHTLGSLELPATMTQRLERLVGHADQDRVRFVIDLLGRQANLDAAKALVNVVATMDRKRAEMAAQPLEGKESAVPLLAKALLETKDADRGWLLRNILRPKAKTIAPAVRKQLLDTALARLASGERGWEALLDVVRDADAKGATEALRLLAAKLRKQANVDKALTVVRLLCRIDHATDDDRYTLASLELARGPRDTRPAVRAGDEALKLIGALLSRGYDVAKALRKDRGVDLEQMYYVGFHFVEAGHPVGEELLSDVVKKGGRAKVARMAKNKLALTEG
jgi:HEAT repeat protein